LSKTKETLYSYRKVKTNKIYARDLYLTGSAQMGGDLTVTGSISGSDIIGVSVTGPIKTSSLTVTGSGVITGSLDVGEDLHVTGSISGSSYENLSTTSNIVGGTLDITGSANIGEDMVVSGSFSAGNITNTGSNIIQGNLSVTGSASIGGNLVVTGSISGSSVQGAVGDMLKSVYDTNDDGTVNNSDKLEGLTVTQVRTHSPASHSGSHYLGEGDAITIAKAQVHDLETSDLTVPNLDVTGSITTQDLVVTGTTQISGSLLVTGSAQVGGNLVVTGSISGSSYEGIVVSDHASTHTSGSSDPVSIYKSQVIDLENKDLTIPGLIVTGSAVITGSLSSVGGDTVITGSLQAGSVHVTGSFTTSGSATISGSVLSKELIVTGSASIGGNLVVTGSISGSSYEGITVSAHASTHQSGSSDPVSLYKSQITDLETLDLQVPHITTTGSGTNGISGSLVVTGQISGSNSGSFSGDIYGGGNLTVSDTVVAQNITGSINVSGSNLYGSDAIVTNITATNITGSSLISGSDFKGPSATITNISGSEESLTGNLYVGGNITGSGEGQFSSDVVVGGNLTVVGSQTFSDTTINGVLTVSGSQKVTGSATFDDDVTVQGTLSGSSLQGILDSTQVLLTGSTYLSEWRHSTDQRYVDGAKITGSIDSNARVAVRKNSAGDGYTRRRINFIEGTNISLTVGDDSSNEEVDVQISVGSGLSGSLGPYSYIVYSGSGTGGPYFAKDSDGDTKFSGSDASTVIQSAIDALTNGGIIFLKGDVDADGKTVTISKSNIALVSGLNQAGDIWQTPRISKILIQASSATVKNIYISGLNVREINFNADGHNIYNVVVDKTQIRPSSVSGYKGIIFRGSGYIYFVRFNDCKISDYYDQSSNDQGTITVTGTNSGNGQIWFNNLDYKAMTDNAVMFCADGGRVDPFLVFNGLSYVEINKSGCKSFKIKADSKISDLHVYDSWFELHDDITIFEIESGSNMNFLCHFHDNTFSVGDSVGDTTTFITNNATQSDWITWRHNGIYGSNNVFHATGDAATFALGTPGTNSRFHFELDYVYSYGTTLKKTKNSGTATFNGDGSTTDFNIAHNMSQTPTIVHLEAKTSDASGDKYWEADSTNITVHFITAPPTGNNNVVLSWKAEV